MLYKQLFTSTNSQERSRETSDYVADLNKILENKVNSDRQRDELNACQNFLIDTEMENGRHKLFNFTLSKLDPNVIDKKTGSSLRKTCLCSKN